MSNVIELRKDAMETIQHEMDRVVLGGASHVALVVTYPGGQQIVLKATSPEAVSFSQASGFQ